MVEVRVTLWIRGKDTAVALVADKSVKAALSQMGSDMSRKLTGITCPVHGSPVKDARIAIGKSGDGDFRYDACCAELQKLVTKATG
jgi:hypothetical protein